jgi:diguanylate cyclase (GGDEF)-like protein/PAS domain S-box-containing protein
MVASKAVGDTSDPEAAELREQVRALRHELDDLKQHLPDALVEGDLATERVTFMNRLACLVFRRSPDEVPGLHGRDLFAEGEFERAQQEMRETLARGYAEGGAYQRTGQQDLREFQMRRGDGTSFPAEIQSSVILDQAGHARGVRTLVRDVTVRKEMEALLEEMSVRDPLTGCYNRRYLDRRRAELEAPDSHWVCLLFDLTDFKSINDTYGHDEGDRVLQAFAHFLARHHRSEDILVRLGGDEFALFIRASSEDDGHAISQRVVEGATKDSPAAFSLGTALKRPGETISALLTRADHVLYASKGRSIRSQRRASDAGESEPG